MTENKFDLLTAKVDGEAKKAENIVRLMSLFMAVVQKEGFSFNDFRAGVDHIAYQLREMERTGKA